MKPARRSFYCVVDTDRKGRTTFYAYKRKSVSPEWIATAHPNAGCIRLASGSQIAQARERLRAFLRVGRKRK